MNGIGLLKQTGIYVDVGKVEPVHLFFSGHLCLTLNVKFVFNRFIVGALMFFLCILM